MNISYRYFFFVVSLSVILISCQSRSADRTQLQDSESNLEGSISLSGAFALYPLANIWAEEFRKIHPDVRINISAGGAGKGMADALGGAVELGMFSREIKEEEKQQGVWWVAVTKDAVLPTISSQNPEMEALQQKGLTRQQFQDIFINQTLKQWGAATGTSNHQKINVYTRSDASGAAATWAEYLGASGQEALKGVGVFGDPGLADALKKDQLGIGFNNVIYVYDLQSKKKYEGIEVIPIDVNEDGIISDQERFYDDMEAITAAIGDGRFPSPPARELYFVAKGRPENPITLTFLQWVLTEGQQFVEQAGYIKLAKASLDQSVQKVNMENL